MGAIFPAGSESESALLESSVQESVMRIDPIRKEGYELLQDGIVALAEVEANGIRIDTRRLASTQDVLTNKIRKLKEELETSELWKVWRRRFATKASLTSRDQLATVLHNELGFKVGETTEGGKPSTDEEALQKINHPDVRTFCQLAKYQKALGTFIKGIEREIVDDRLHPVYNLHLARTYRSSSDSPNFQNFPVRDKEIAEIIRSLFIPSEGCVLVENDFKGIEVALSAAYHHDPVFIDYITTPGKDMHRDMAAQLYLLEPKQVDKDIRYGAKNKFVFPQFYGDFYVSCARSLWEWMRTGKLKGPDGKPLREHLKEQGIERLGACDPEEKPLPRSFEKHVKAVEDDFWNRRFKVYGQWRKQWYQDYLEKGSFDLLTGFRVAGAFARNAVTNYPIQGSAFHCLLWSLIQINRTLAKRKMQSKVVGQIHDSLLGDVKVGELGDYLSIVEDVTMKQLPRHWHWLNVPPEIEYEICPPGGNWFQKKEFKFKQGRFTHPQQADKSTTDSERFVRALGKATHD